MIGHGLGGNIAIELLRKRPDAVTRIALISTDPLPEAPQQAAEQEALLVAAKTAILPPASRRCCPCQPCTRRPGGRGHGAGAGHGGDPWSRPVPAASAGDCNAGLTSRRPAQGNIPTLIMTGASDTLVPRRRAEFLAAMMPQGCLEIIPEAGHLPQLEQPEAVTRALETFLAGRLPTLMLR